MQYPADDTEFREFAIEKVTEEGHGGYVIVCDGWHLSCGKDCTVAPKVGQTARQYGRGIGSPVRGLFIDGNKIWYRSPTEDAEYRDIELYGADARDWLRRWDEGRGVFSISMGGLGPGYEQCIQIAVAEMLRWFIEHQCDPSLWADPEKWKSERDAMDEHLLDKAGTLGGLGLSGARGVPLLALHLVCIEMGPAPSLKMNESKTGVFRFLRNFPGSAAA